MRAWAALSPLVIVLILSTGSARGDEALAKSKNCMACHALDAKRIGPSFRDIARRYAGQKDVDAALAERVIKGSKGVWKAELKAEVVMPPNPRVKPDEAARIVQWILGQK
ncbi:MAG: c-type cytochrome [Propionivibrio sp.]|jgi:cytochrome c|nr:c-type cytochrome [Propionivibrio sp.]